MALRAIAHGKHLVLVNAELDCTLGPILKTYADRAGVVLTDTDGDHSEQPLVQRYMKIYKMGDGPVYTFYRPYHLSPLETPLTIARAALFGDAALTPGSAPTCDVIALAKKDLQAGETLDGVGGFTCYGVMENTPVARRDDLMPLGLTDGCVLKRDLAKDAEIRFADVDLPPDRVSDRSGASKSSASRPGRSGSGPKRPSKARSWSASSWWSSTRAPRRGCRRPSRASRTSRCPRPQSRRRGSPHDVAAALPGVAVPLAVRVGLHGARGRRTVRSTRRLRRAVSPTSSRSAA